MCKETQTVFFKKKKKSNLLKSMCLNSFRSGDFGSPNLKKKCISLMQQAVGEQTMAKSDSEIPPTWMNRRAAGCF